MIRSWNGPVLTVCLLFVVVCPDARRGEEYSSATENVLWYQAPASNWETQALPIGNGRLGGMIFGGVEREHVQFNEDSLWIGDEHDTGAYQAFGDLHIQFGDAAGVVGVTNPSEHPPARGQDVEMTVDGKPGTKWCMEHGGRPVVWQMTFPATVDVPLTSYTLTSAGDVPTRDPQQWQLLGSEDGMEWTVLDERRLEGPFRERHMAQAFTFDNEKRFRSYRFVFQLANESHFQVAEIALGEPGSVFRQATGATVAESYVRALDIARALHKIRYTRDGTIYQRTYFCSHPDQVMVLRFTADKPAAYSGRVSLADTHQGKIMAEGSRITATGSLAGYVYSGGSSRERTETYELALDYEAQVLVLNEGGTLEARNGQIVFKGCNALTLLLVAGTDYQNQRDKGWKGERPHERISSQLARASEKSFDALLEDHVRDYQGLFDRLRLDLGTTPESTGILPTDERLAAYRQGGVDPDLEELLFQYARYMMISSSRPGSLPANLQGLWNMSNSPPWRSDYHTDVNIEMNYWFVDPANLSECFEPLAEWLYSIRGVRRDETRETFGTRGWITHAENGIFGGSTWKWSKGDAAWVAQEPLGPLCLHPRQGIPAHSGLSADEGSVRVLGGSFEGTSGRDAGLSQRLLPRARP